MIYPKLFDAELPLMDLVAEELLDFCLLHGIDIEVVTAERFEDEIMAQVIAEGGEATATAQGFGIIPFGRVN